MACKLFYLQHPLEMSDQFGIGKFLAIFFRRKIVQQTTSLPNFQMANTKPSCHLIFTLLTNKENKCSFFSCIILCCSQINKIVGQLRVVKIRFEGNRFCFSVEDEKKSEWDNDEGRKKSYYMSWLSESRCFTYRSWLFVRNQLHTRKHLHTNISHYFFSSSFFQAFFFIFCVFLSLVFFSFFYSFSFSFFSLRTRCTLRTHTHTHTHGRHNAYAFNNKTSYKMQH